MSLVYAAYVGVPLVTIPIGLGLAAWVYSHHRNVRGSQWFVVTLLLATCWMIFAALEFVLSTPEHQIFATTIATKFAVLSFMAYVVFASRYANADFHRHWLVKGLFGFVVVITLLPTWMDPFQSLLYEELTVSTQPIQYVTIEPGPLYAAIGISLAVLTAYAMYVLVRYMLSTPRRSGLQLALIVLGSLSIMIAITLGNLGVFPIQEATNARFGSLPFDVLTSLALFRFRLFEMQPVARNVVVENLRDPVLVLDRDRCLVDFNAASVDIWPQVDGAIGEAVGEACPDVAAELEITDRTVETSGQLALVVDGQRRHYSVDVSTVGGDDPSLYAILLRDVTDLERSRWQLATQNERLDQVAATISHDLRNPINVAAGYAEMIEGLLAPDDPNREAVDSARDHLRRVQAAHDRMEEIIEDVLTLAREGQSVEATEILSVRDVARDAWENVATADATLTIADDRTLAADRSKLLTLLENLYRNAVEHGSGDVEVTVGALEDGFFVADDGPGIPDEDADAVFEYGYTTEESGTGLGLSIVRTIAESHGWTVALDGDAGGARFEFRNVTVEASPDGEAVVAAQGIVGNAPRTN